ncbi:MAG: hypothetical protein IJ828_06255 [Treponema sp.]|nr:hypothetical protein [Treponema sp.]
MAKFGRADIRKIIGEACTDEMENQLIALHLGVVDPLKDELNNIKADAAKIEKLQKEVEKLNAEKKDGEDWKAKFEKEHADFGEYKTQVEKDKAADTIKGLYRSLLKESKVDDKRIDSILKVTDFSAMKVDKDGKLEGADKLSESIKNDWKDFIVQTQKQGADVETPPENHGGKMTREEIMKIKDTTKRQEAIANNLELFGG